MRSVIGILCAFAATVATASDAYLVRFSAGAPPQGCFQLGWRDNVLFYNQGDAPVSVTLLGMSNGPTPADAPHSILLPPHRVVSLNDTLVVAHSGVWKPLSLDNLWVVHIDVPPGVVVESRDEYERPNTCIIVPLYRPLGKVSMPVIRALTPAGMPQVVLGTDLGAQVTRTNVGIYNDAPVPAIATITLRATCDDVILDSRIVTVPAHSIQQFSGFQPVGGSSACFFSNSARYVTVTVDQPSFVYVANVTEAIADTSGMAPTVGLAVAHNEKF